MLTGCQKTGNQRDIFIEQVWLESGEKKEERQSEEIPENEKTEEGVLFQESEGYESLKYGEASEISLRREPQESAYRTEHVHRYQEKVVAATCTAEGYTLYQCNCGDHYTARGEKALGHRYGSWESVKDATYTEEGEKSRCCLVCGMKEVQSIPVKMAGPEAEEEIGEKVVYYINQFRIAQGSTEAIRLAGLKEVAQYRSQQLVKNFSHDRKDEQEALNQCRYGLYVSAETMESWGMTITEPYYRFNEGREAIGSYLGGGGPPDAIAKALATGCRNSAGHWFYVGSSAYPYIAVGITCDGWDRWYCSIYMSRTKEYE